MDDLNYCPSATRLIVEAKLLDAEPFMLFDVGCRGGIHSLWREFGRNLHAHAFDPEFEECERLQLAEGNPNVHYHTAYVGLPDGHEFMRCKAVVESRHRILYTHFVHSRSSAWAHRDIGKQPTDSIPRQESARNPPGKITLAEFVHRNTIDNIDFVKVDTDGADLEVLHSLGPDFEKTDILGFEVECVYQGSDDFTSNSFHNIDRFMKQHGFMVYGMSCFRYSRQALPGPYLNNFPGHTSFGQPLWGDVLFLRDLQWDAECGAGEVSLEKVLKMICLLEFFRLPDCAAELIVNNRDRIAGIISPDTLLDFLTPNLDGRTVSYQEYCQTLKDNPRMLFPS